MVLSRLYAAPNDAREICREVRPYVLNGARIVSKDRSGMLRRRASLEGTPSGRHLVEDDGGWPYCTESCSGSSVYVDPDLGSGTGDPGLTPAARRRVPSIRRTHP
jgi:hypothetical protein